MLKAVLRFCALAFLCLLLVYAPELYTALSAPYTVSVPDRVLLRISLSTDDPASADAFYDALTLYMKEHPTLHIRVTRPDASSLFALPDPQPDLFVFSSSISFDQAAFLAQENAASSVITLSPPDGEALLCGVSRESPHPDYALDLLFHLSASSMLDKHSDSAI